MKLAVVTSIPTPYRDPFWNEVAAHQDITTLDVYYCAAGKPDRPWEVDWPREFDWHVLPSYNLKKWAGADMSAYWVHGLQHELKRGGHDAVIVGGYNHPSMLQTMYGCVRRGQPYFLMSETYRRRKSWKTFVKDCLLSYFCRRAAGGMPTGKLATEYLRSYGISEDRLIPVPNVPDIQRLQNQAQSLRIHGGEVRRRLGLPQESPVMTFVGRMIPRKRPELVIRAFAACDEKKARLIMLGDGPLMPTCRKLVNDLGLEDRVLLPGFCQPDEVPRYLSVSNAFVLPSSETWGVAAIEAAAMGVPAIVSSEVGCHPDLIRHIETGIVVPIDCVGAITSAATYYLNRPHHNGFRRTESQFEEFRYANISDRLVRRIRELIHTDANADEYISGVV